MTVSRQAKLVFCAHRMHTLRLCILETIHSVSVELLKMENVPARFFCKSDIMVILCIQNAWFQKLLFEACFLLEMMHIGNHAFCVGRTAENGKCSLTLFCKNDKSVDSVETKRMVSNSAF